MDFDELMKLVEEHGSIQESYYLRSTRVLILKNGEILAQETQESWV
jgi:hypothetical protein